MGVKDEEAEEKEESDSEREDEITLKKTTKHSIATWWPAIMPTEADSDRRTSSSQSPEELWAQADLQVKLEPYPRVQVVPRDWICEELPDAEKARRRACAGQVLLAYYSQASADPDAEVWGAHPAPRADGDVTLLLGDAHLHEPRHQEASAIRFTSEPSHRSERSVRCKLLRELVSPQEAYVYVQCAKHKHRIRVPLDQIRSVHKAGRKSLREKREESRRKVMEWFVKRSPEGVVEVIARQAVVGSYGQDNWSEEISLQGAEVKFFQLDGGVTRRGDATTASFASASTLSSAPTARRKQSVGNVLKVVARPSHYEVLFDDVVPDARWTSAYSLGKHLLPRSVRRLRHPELTIHDLPDDLQEVEVSVGYARTTKLSAVDPDIKWSKPSKPCTVPKVSTSLLAPLAPWLQAKSLSRAQVSWILPEEPAPLLFRIRLREMGAEDWCFLDSFGRAREVDTSLAWRSRLVPLVEGLWASAFGEFDGRKASTPSPARIRSVDGESSAVTIEFEQPAEELTIGGLRPSALACTQCNRTGTAGKLSLKEEEQSTVHIDWIEAVWVSDGSNYFKGMPLPVYVSQKEVILEDAGEGNVSLRVDGEDELPPLVVNDQQWLQLLQSGNGLKTVQLGAHGILGLKSETTYEVCVQALTKDGWTSWSSPGTVEMPRIGYEQAELVSDKTGSVFYRAAILPQAFYKEYDRCWDSVEEALTPDRYERLRAALTSEGEVDEVFDVRRSRWLVDMEGPIRESGRMDEDDAVQLIRNLVSLKANVNFKDQATGRMPLTYACEYGKWIKPRIIEELLDLGADVDSMNDSRQTALSIAAWGGHAQIVKILLERGADATIVSLKGETAFLQTRYTPGMRMDVLKNMEICRQHLTVDRVPWEVFESRMRAAPDPRAAAVAFLELAFPDGPKTMFVADKDGKRISKHDRLRLYEQIAEMRDGADEGAEAERRGSFCAQALLLPQVEAAAMQIPKNDECGHFARYLLFSGIMKWCKDEAKAVAKKCLDHYEKELRQRRDGLKRLPLLTQKGEEIVVTRWKKFAGRSLHQWHAHDNLNWLNHQNVVGTFEVLVHSGAVPNMEDFCAWIGELNAQIAASDSNKQLQLGAWNKRLPAYFWGSVYTKFLLGEADRAASIFHNIAAELAQKAGVSYKTAPNKQPGRVLKKQFDYATPALTLLHEALDLMVGRFRKAYRADLLDSDVQDVSDPDPPQTGAALVLGKCGELGRAVQAVKVALSVEPASEGVLVVLFQEPLKQDSPKDEDEGAEGDAEVSPEEVIAKARDALLEAGAGAVVFTHMGLEGSAMARRLLTEGLQQMRLRSEADEDESTYVHPFSEKSQVTFDIRKSRTGDSSDLYCTGGLLDLVRGSLTCHTEEEVEQVYHLARNLTVENDRATVVRVKNGFHTPAIGGYSDLKLFLLIAYDEEASKTKVCHICELQLHLKKFLDCKRFTHMPYVIDRGDFDL